MLATAAQKPIQPAMQPTKAKKIPYELLPILQQCDEDLVDSGFSEVRAYESGGLSSIERMRERRRIIEVKWQC
jgi:hypothetical protein